jgi:glycosyltransferase involved in cell wall biosynthesis
LDPNLKILYRISDGGNLKYKLQNANKTYCLQNCIHVFGTEGFYLFADNCKESTISKLNVLHVNLYQTSLGNAASWRHVVQFAINNFDHEDVIYLVEDDYLHLPGARQVLSEGIQIADYVTLYDHPDKYVSPEQGGNPFVKYGGESTRVLLTNSSHWKITNSTTMTFATTVKTILKDKNIWWKYTSKNTPQDFKAFGELCGHSLLKNKFISPKRKLISCIPGKATHTELNNLAPLADWGQV